ncbi:GMC oxidoreductase [Didymella exigua CBS 183.55]|uniref:GMC oxidoreductase n=1 Tax=Didymella exigua CBS 183.55 TaxID=1150837 RepID=A0A6A5RBY6_9PLEO|nr:GMC oxidoreductase [Didymella exigua CBS 183.55]KAF1925755.1 GMC oxidoreductase [Didymella exigua CBS 183.55]
MLSMAKCRLLTWAALSASNAFAHPLFNGRLVTRADELLKEYDYVVVGGGASGLTVANRLSEQSAVTVLVIEAGQFDQNEDFVTIPGLAGGAVGTKYDWNTTYAASEFLGGRNVSVAQGKIVGGSTKLNRMVFDRGAKSDYDGWEALGNEGWNWESLLPYFKKNEIFSPPVDEIRDEYNITWDENAHGYEGHMHSTYSPFIWPTTKNLVEATRSLNIPIPHDQANGNAIGGYFTPHNMDPTEYRRSSADEAYYDTAAKRENFHLIAGHQATRILTYTNSTVKATGVEFAASSNATVQSVKAKREVILAAGTLHTPQLLQVSGIGDPALLSNIDVPTVVNLPAVGQSLHDHVYVAVVNAINTTLAQSSLLTSNATFAAEARHQYDSEKRGPYTSPTGDFLLFLPLSTYTNESATIHAAALAADASLSLPSDAPAEVAAGYAASYESLNSKLLADDAAFLEILWSDGVMVLGLEHPYSRGSVKAGSKSMFDAPIADAGFLRNPLDTVLLREALRFSRRLVAQPSIAELNPFEAVPGANVTSDADIDAYIKNSAGTLWHPAGSCKLGKREDGGVVDAELKVYGIEGLRIVDASVFPILPAAHTMTTVYAVAERAADIMKRVGKEH